MTFFDARMFFVFLTFHVVSSLVQVQTDIGGILTCAILHIQATE